MSDFKFYPQDLPKALQSGYTAKHKPNMLRTAMADGYVRQRLVNQGAPDTVSAQIMMTESQYREFLEWYKGDIQCGASWFVMPLLSVDVDSSLQYRYCRIQNGEVNAAVVTTNAKDGTIYRLTMTLDVSNTIVDDGSWEDHYLPTADDGSAQGEFVAIPTADIIDDADDLGDSSGTYTIIEE
jgi:hypothetical protein